MRRTVAAGTLGRRGKLAVGSLASAALAGWTLLAAGVTSMHAAASEPSVDVRPLAVTTVPAPSTTTTAPPAPTTTTTPPPARTVQSAQPATPPPPAPAPAPALVRRGILPPSEPPANIPPSPDFLRTCQGSQYDDSPGCVNAVLGAIDNARATEGLPAMSLPSNWAQLTPEEQTFVATNLERTVRGLAPLAGMVDALDQSAAQGAAASTDPSPPSGYPYTQWGSNWAGAVGNPLEAMYYWMYDDGLGSSNIDCTQSNQSGCWGHRNNVLLNLTCQMCVIGTGFDPTGWNGNPSLAELLVDSSGQPAIVFSWQQERAYL